MNGMADFADTYVEISDPKGYMRGWEGWDHPERSYIASLVEGRDSFLDVGCGGGITYEALHKIGYLNNDEALECIKYKGVDYSQKFIDACKELFPDVEWEVQDALHLKEADNSWDVVYLRNVIENCSYYDAPIREAFRVARRLVIITIWQPLQGVDCIMQVGPYTWGNRYEKKAFWKFLRTFKKPIVYRCVKVPEKEGGRQLTRWVFCIYKRGYSEKK